MNREQLRVFRDRLENTRTDVIAHLNSLLVWDRTSNHRALFTSFPFDRLWRRNIRTVDRAVANLLAKGCSE